MRWSSRARCTPAATTWRSSPALRSPGSAPKGESQGLPAIEPLGKVLAHDADANVRYAAAYALMRSKKPEAQPALVFGLKDGDAQVRAACARGLADGTQLEDARYLLERL